MARSPNARRCAVPGCKSWAVRREPYCIRHYEQWLQDQALGLADPTPRKPGARVRACSARGCRRRAITGGDYCPDHTALLRASARRAPSADQAAELSCERLTSLLDRLDAEPLARPDMLRREVELLAMARRALLPIAESSFASGWNPVSPAEFMRLWLTSAEAAKSLAQTLFVMEAVTAGDVSTLLDGVYRRSKASAPEGQS